MALCFFVVLSFLVYHILYNFLLRKRRFVLMQSIFPLGPCCITLTCLVFIGALLQRFHNSCLSCSIRHLFGGKDSTPFLARLVYHAPYFFLSSSLSVFVPLPSFILSLIDSWPEFGTTEILWKNPWHSGSVKQSAASLHSTLVRIVSVVL